MEIDRRVISLFSPFVSRNYLISVRIEKISTIAVSNNSDLSPSLPNYGKLYAYDCSAYASLPRFSPLFDEANKELGRGGGIVVSGWRLFRDVDVYDGFSLRLAV